MDDARETTTASDPESLLRILGGLLFAAGALALFIRKSTDNRWGDFALLLVLLVPCVVFFVLGSGFHDGTWNRPGLRPERAAAAWQSVLVVLAVVLAPLALFQFIEVVNGNSGDSLNLAWIFGVTGALALYGTFAVGVSYGGLLAALSLLIAWLTLWNKILSSPSATTFRWLLVVIAVIFLIAAIQLEQRSLRQAVDFVTGSGIAAVAAGVLGVISLGVQYIARSIASSFGTTVPVSGARQHQEWDVFLLAVALALVWYGSRRRARGPTYVGAVALAAFVISVGVELVKLLTAGGHASGDIVGWPLLPLLAGGAVLVLGFRRQPAP